MEKIGRKQGFDFYYRRAKEMSKRGIIIVLLLCIYPLNFVYPDIFEVPCSCYPKVIQEVFSNHGYKVDINPSERDYNSWAYIDNRGTSFNIVTYHSINYDELKSLREICISLMDKIKVTEESRVKVNDK